MKLQRIKLSVLALALGAVAAISPLGSVAPVGAQGAAVQVDTADIAYSDLRISFNGYPGGSYDFGEVIEVSCCGGAGADLGASMYLEYPGAVRAGQPYTYKWCIDSISTLRSYGGYEHGIDNFTFDGNVFGGTAFGTQFGTTSTDYTPDKCVAYTATAPNTVGAAVGTTIPGKPYSFRVGAGLAGSPIVGPNGPIGFATATGTSPSHGVNLNVLTAPAASNDGPISVLPNGTVDVPVLDNDSIGTGARPGTVTGLTITSQAANGTCGVTGNNVTYTSNGTLGADQCTYRWNQDETDDVAPSNGTVQAVVNFVVEPPAPPVPGAVYVPITPCRVVDTRSAGGTLASKEIRDFVVTGSGAAFASQGGAIDGCAIPDEAQAVEASVSAISPENGGFFRAYPADQSEPTATFLNSSKAQNITNTGSIPLASSGATDLKVRNYGGDTHYVIDIQGYFIDPLVQAGATYFPITPCRIVDTRNAVGTFANQETRGYSVTGTGADFRAQGGKTNGCGVPDGAVAVEASVASVSPSANGYFRAFPTGQPVPNATFLNFTKGQNITNTGSIGLATGEDSDVTVRNYSATSHYTIDIQGYFLDGDVAGGALYVPVTPCRIVDTRTIGGPFSSLENREYVVSGSSTAFAAQGGKGGGCEVPEGAQSVEASVAAVQPSTAGFFRAFPADELEPTATFLNYFRNQNITNTGAVSMATTGEADLEVRNYGGTTQYVIDVQGYFTVPPAPA